MKLLFINELGPNYKYENIYEFIFGNKTDELWGDDWDSVPAHGKPGPPEIIYINKVGRLEGTKTKLELVQNSDYFGMEHALDNVVALGWETYSEDDSEDNEERMVFHFGEDIQTIQDKLYSRDIVLKFDKLFEQCQKTENN
jgi:hypothetical protein|tara:strand:- start:1259 stop:1681 length:423 start_codon:yes stop_codon:yes gene_type:complete